MQEKSTGKSRGELILTDQEDESNQNDDLSRQAEASAHQAREAFSGRRQTHLGDCGTESHASIEINAARPCNEGNCKIYYNAKDNLDKISYPNVLE